MEVVIFNGQSLTSRCTVLSERGVPRPIVALEDVPGSDGVFARGTSYQPPEVTLHLFATDMSRAERRSMVHELMGIFRVDDFKRLQFGDDSNLYYMAQPNGEIEFHEFIRNGRLTVPMLVRDAAMYGLVKSVVVGTSNVEFTVGGNYPTTPTVASTDARKSSSDLWGVRLDDGKYERVPLSSLSAASNVTITGSTRQVRVNGQTSMITLDSDWLKLEPGTHTMRVDQGEGSARVTWTERWL